MLVLLTERRSRSTRTTPLTAMCRYAYFGDSTEIAWIVRGGSFRSSTNETPPVFGRVLRGVDARGVGWRGRTGRNRGGGIRQSTRCRIHGLLGDRENSSTRSRGFDRLGLLEFLYARGDTWSRGGKSRRRAERHVVRQDRALQSGLRSGPNVANVRGARRFGEPDRSRGYAGAYP